MFPAWMLDSSGFYYAALDPAVSLSDVSVFRQKLDAAPVARRENYEATHSVTWAKPAADGKHTMIIADHLNPRPDYIREESAGNDRSGGAWRPFLKGERSEEHTSELQSLMRISYAVFCLKKKKEKHNDTTTTRDK